MIPTEFRAPLAVALLALTQTSGVVAQRSCPPALTVRADYQVAVLSLVRNRLAGLTSRRAREARGPDGWYPITFSALGSSYDSTLAQLRESYSDTLVAAALTFIVSGRGGHADDQGAAAAEFYAAWQLPPEAASVVARDFRLGAARRLTALHALRVYWGSPTLDSIVIAVLCDLDAVAGAYRERRGYDQPLLPLPEPEFELLSLLPTVTGGSIARFGGLLGPQSALGGYVAQH